MIEENELPELGLEDCINTLHRMLKNLQQEVEHAVMFVESLHDKEKLPQIVATCRRADAMVEQFGPHLGSSIFGPDIASFLYNAWNKDKANKAKKALP